MKKVVFLLVAGLVALWGIGPAFADDDTVGLTEENADAIFTACQAAALAEASPVFRPTRSHTVMWCAVVDREGELLLIKATDTGEDPFEDDGLDTDAWRGSIEIAIAKAYTSLAFSNEETAVTSRAIGELARPDDPSGGPLFGIGNTNPYRPLTGSRDLRPDDRLSRKHHGIVTFPGGVPVYNCQSGILLGAVGVSGDGVEEDEDVAEGAVTGAGFCLSP